MHALYRWMHACSCIARRARPATAEHARSIVGHMLSRTQAVALPVSFRPGKTASTGPAVQDHYHPFPHSSRSNALQRPRGPDVCARASHSRALFSRSCDRCAHRPPRSLRGAPGAARRFFPAASQRTPPARDRLSKQATAAAQAPARDRLSKQATAPGQPLWGVQCVSLGFSAACAGRPAP